MSYREDLKEKDDLIEILESRAVEMMERKEDLFSSITHSGCSHSLLDSSDWKGVANRYAKENKRLKAQIARFIGKRQCVE